MYIFLFLFGLILRGFIQDTARGGICSLCILAEGVFVNPV